MSGSADMRQVGPADKWISRAAAATVTALAALAGAISYSHMLQLAQQHGQAGWHAHAFPLSVDGVEVVASLVRLTDRRAGRRPGWLPWIAMAIGTVGRSAVSPRIGTVAAGVRDLTPGEHLPR